MCDSALPDLQGVVRMPDRVAVIGGGAGALWVTREAILSGFTCSLFGESPLASWASTRNQGWLQSGALYAGQGDIVTAEDCWIGSHELRGYAPDAIESGVPSYFLFSTRSACEEFAGRCLERGIFVAETRIDAIRHSLGLGLGLSEAALRTRDAPMNSHAILSRVANEVVRLGATFNPCDPRLIDLSHSGGYWVVECNGERAAFDFVILASGPYGPMFFHRNGFDTPPSYPTTKIAVLSVSRQMRCPALLIGQPDAAFTPNVVPFSWGTGGFTVALTKADEPGDPGDEAAPEGAAEDLKSMTGNWYPELYDSSTPCTTHVCHKIGAGTRHYVIEEIEKGAFYFYPGKFTTSRLAARVMIGRLGGNASVSEQPYGRSSG